MFIHGVGVAFPERSLSSDDRAALGIKLNAEQQRVVSRSGVVSQGISLPLEYIQATGNVDVLEGWKVATHTPTGLGVQATREALSQAGTGIESIGLVVADTATPYQTCPSEAQRIAGEFGLKLPAYDIVGGIGVIPHYLSMFSSWREDRLPDYALCFSTNTPSQHVRYRDDAVTASLLGDGAAALVVSRKHAGPVRVVDVRMTHEVKRRTPLVVDGPVRFDTNAMVSKQELAEFLGSEIARVTSGGFEIDSTTMIIPPQLYAAEAAEMLVGKGFSAEQIVSAVGSRGFTIGSSYGLALAQTWAALASGGAVVILHCGDGMRGSVILSSC